MYYLRLPHFTKPLENQANKFKESFKNKITPRLVVLYDQMHTSLLPIANSKELLWPDGLQNVS